MQFRAIVEHAADIVVIVTAHPYGSVGKRAVDAGCDGWLNKPCDPRRLLQEVQRRVGAPN